MNDGKTVTQHVAILAISLGANALEGRVVVDLWRWFVAPLGVALIAYWQALGVVVLINLLTRQNGLTRDTDDAAAEHAAVVLVAWLSGWLFHLCGSK